MECKRHICKHTIHEHARTHRHKRPALHLATQAQWQAPKSAGTASSMHVPWLHEDTRGHT
jgi:hypothetical protein